MKRPCYFVILVLVSAILSGCLSPTMYVDTALPSVSKADVAASESPQPIQLLFEFQSKGSANARATEFTKETVFKVINDSGLFSTVSGEPQPNQRRLTIVINNFPITQDAASKGFVVGLTFGAAGTTITDGYDCKATLTVPGAAPVALEYKHALHTTIGNATPPGGIKPEPTPKEAVEKMISQLMWSIMRDVSKAKALQ